MKNTITNIALVLIAFVAVNLLMSFAKPISADEPKQYMVVKMGGNTDKLEQAVNQKLTEGWHLQGGVSFDGGRWIQAMTK